MIIIGLTGNIGSGKTTIANIFKLLGIPVFDADNEAKQQYLNPEILMAVRAIFGSTVFTLEGEINKEHLAKAIFTNANLRKQLEEIIHPAVNNSFRYWCKQHAAAPYVIEEAAIMVESNLYKEMDYLIVVTAPMKVRVERIAKRNHLSEEQIMQRINNQLPEEKLMEQAHFTINNDGTTAVIPQILQIHKQLLEIASR